MALCRGHPRLQALVSSRSPHREAAGTASAAPPPAFGSRGCLPRLLERADLSAFEAFGTPGFESWGPGVEPRGIRASGSPTVCGTPPGLALPWRQRLRHGATSV